MAKGHENLIPTNKRSKDEARKFGKKGGEESGKTRRQQKALRTILKEALAVRLADITDAGAKKTLLQASGSKDENKTVGEIVIDGMLRASVRGNSQMMKMIMQLTGNDPELKLKREELALKKKALEKVDENKNGGLLLGVLEKVWDTESGGADA